MTRFGIDDPRVARPSLQHAADSKYCLRCGRPYVYDAAYVGHLGDYRCAGCGAARPPLDVAAREIELDGLAGSSFELATTAGTTRDLAAAAGPLQRLQRAGGASLALALGASLDEVRRARRLLGRLRPARAHRGRRPQRADAADQEPGRCERGDPDAAGGGARRTLLIALNDAIADGRDVSWIWDVDFEPLLEQAERIVVSGDRAAELALRFVYGGFAS